MFEQDRLCWKRILLFFTHKYWPVSRAPVKPQQEHGLALISVPLRESSASHLLLFVLTDPISMKTDRSILHPSFSMSDLSQNWNFLGWYRVFEAHDCFFFPRIDVRWRLGENLLMASRWNPELGGMQNSSLDDITRNHMMSWCWFIFYCKVSSCHTSLGWSQSPMKTEVSAVLSPLCWQRVLVWSKLTWLKHHILHVLLVVSSC